MDPVIIILIVMLVILFILTIMYAAEVPPFNRYYIAPDPRTGEILPYPTGSVNAMLEFQKEFDYGPYSANIPSLEIYNVYRYFFCSYCNRGDNAKKEACAGTGMMPVSYYIPGVTEYDEPPEDGCLFPPNTANAIPSMRNRGVDN